MPNRELSGLVICLALTWSLGCDDDTEKSGTDIDTDTSSETETLHDSNSGSDDDDSLGSDSNDDDSTDSDTNSMQSRYRMVLQLPESFSENPVGVIPVFFTGEPGTGSGMPQATGEGLNNPVVGPNKQILLEGQVFDMTGTALVSGSYHVKVILYIKTVSMGATPGVDYIGYSKETLDVGSSLADYGTIEMKLAE